MYDRVPPLCVSVRYRNREEVLYTVSPDAWFLVFRGSVVPSDPDTYRSDATVGVEQVIPVLFTGRVRVDEINQWGLKYYMVSAPQECYPPRTLLGH